MTDTNQRQWKYFSDMLTEGERELLHYMPTINELMEFACKQYNKLPAISDGKITYTYEELYNRVAVRRGHLKKLGYKKGDHIAVFAPNTLDAMELYFAIVTGGYVSVMMPASLIPQALAGLLKKFDVRGIFYDKTLEERLPDFIKIKNTTEYVECEPIEPENVTKDTICSICMTGGTTGTPKGAVMTHGAMMRGAFNGCFISRGVLYNRYIAILPLSHIFGLVKGFLSCIYTGGLIFECRDVKRGIGMIPILKPTTLVVVPGMAEIIVGLTKMKGKAFSESLKMLIIGAAPVPPRLMREIDALGIGVLAGYGLTEGANLTSGNKNVLEKPDSMGMIYPEQRYKIVDGELRVKGDNLMQGYYNDAESTAAVFDEEGYLRTGDLVRMDEDGLIYITGRIKNLIILANGENVSPEEIEEEFYKNDSIKDCLVKEMEMNGKYVIGIEILPYEPAVDGKSSDEIEEMFKRITADINQKLNTFKQVSKIVIRTEDFKRTPAMKIDRNQ